MGFIVAPAIGLVVLALGWCAVPALNPSGSFASCWAGGSVLPVVAGLGALFAYPAAIVFGIPLFMLFRRRAWLQWWQVALGGILVAAVSVLALSLYGRSVSGALDYFLLCGSVGFASGIAFWGIAVCRNSALTPRC